MSVEELGMLISGIIQQNGDDKTDGQVIDDIVQLLKEQNLYIIINGRRLQ